MELFLWFLVNLIGTLCIPSITSGLHVERCWLAGDWKRQQTENDSRLIKKQSANRNKRIIIGELSLSPDFDPTGWGGLGKGCRNPSIPLELHWRCSWTEADRWFLVRLAEEKEVSSAIATKSDVTCSPVEGIWISFSGPTVSPTVFISSHQERLEEEIQSRREELGCRETQMW